jgi:hypothetical protein
MTTKEYWLPDNYALKLNALELGALTTILISAQRRGEASFPINKPGPEGEKIQTTMVDRLLEKATSLCEEAYR